MIDYAVAWLTDQQKADLIVDYIRKHGASTGRQICEGTNPQLNWGQFLRGRFYLHHVMQVTLGEPFSCHPTTYKYDLPDVWYDNLFNVAKHLRALRTYHHLVASNLTASLDKFAGTPDESEIEDLLIMEKRLFEDMERFLKRVNKKHAGIAKGRDLPSL